MEGPSTRRRCYGFPAPCDTLQPGSGESSKAQFQGLQTRNRWHKSNPPLPCRQKSFHSCSGISGSKPKVYLLHFLSFRNSVLKIAFVFYYFFKNLSVNRFKNHSFKRGI
ncbi:UNVERIFIED_CONTAM: hypothetical protein K2H54_042328 [Gekko kuhli]